MRRLTFEDEDIPGRLKLRVPRPKIGTEQILPVPRKLNEIAAEFFISVRTAGKSLPESFIRQEWNISDRTLQLPHCLTAKRECDALIVDLDDDGVDEILLFSSPTGTSTAFKLVDGTWTVFIDPQGPAKGTLIIKLT